MTPKEPANPAAEEAISTDHVYLRGVGLRNTAPVPCVICGTPTRGRDKRCACCTIDKKKAPKV